MGIDHGTWSSCTLRESQLLHPFTRSVLRVVGYVLIKRSAINTSRTVAVVFAVIAGKVPGGSGSVHWVA